MKVVQWTSQEDFTEHSLPLYPDDTLLTTLTKAMGLLDITQEKLVPYVWSKDTPLRFNILKSNWNHYNAHPFKSPLEEKPAAPEVKALPERILEIEELNFITYTDLAKIATKQTLRYYFPNDKDKFDPASLTSALYQQTILQDLENVATKVHSQMTARSTTSYLRAFYSADFASVKVPFRQWFERLSATKLIPFIQLYEDINHIYYKVLKEHTIPPSYFIDWTQLDKMKNQYALLFYSFIKGQSYGKFFFDYDTSTLQVQYFLDITDAISYPLIHNHLKEVLAELQKRWGVRLVVEVDRFALKTDVQVKNVTLNDIFLVGSKLLPVFKLPEKNRLAKNILDLQYIRVPKYGQSINLVDFMKSKIHYGIPLVDIIEELKAYGIEELTVREYYEQILQEQELPAAKVKRNFKNLGLLMHITPVAAGFNIYIDNAVSDKEIERALYWTRCMLAKAAALHVESKVKEPKVVVESEEEEDVVVLPPGPGEVSKSTSRASSELSLGGAIGKKHQRYFKNMLEKLDPDLFAKSDNYARKCQISDLRQPVGITLEQKEKIDSLGYADGYDNSLVYGSDPNRPHVYMCPKIWCPGQQIPLTYEKYQALGEKCPDPNDDPILLYTTSSWYNDPLRKHYVGFLKEKGYNNLRLPCCFKTPKEVGSEQKPGGPGPGPSSKPRSVEDSYIIDKMKPIEAGRLGTLPNSLHEFLYPNVPYTLCRNTVKAEQCLLRKGTNSGQLLDALTYLLDMSLEEMLLQLDPFTFMTLENGQVYRLFMPDKIPKVTHELKVWLDKFPGYVQRFGLSDILEHIDNPKEAPIDIQYRMARQAILRESYYRFIQYVKSPEANNPHLFFDWVHHLGAILVVWNRDSQSIATLKCPFATKNKWEYGLPYVLVLQQEDVFEPLVLVDRDKNMTQKIAFTPRDRLKWLLEQCPVMMQREDKLLEEVRSLGLWIKHVLGEESDFALERAVLDPQDKVIGLFCKNGVWVKLPMGISLFSLKRLFEIVPIQEIVYHEDIAGQSVDVEINIEDYRLFDIKIKKLGFGVDLGTILEDGGDYLLALYTVPEVKYPLPPKLPLQLKDTFIRRSDLIDHDNANWYKAKKTILTKLLKEYDNLVLPLLKKPLLEQLEHLREVFDYMQEPAKVAVLLEEFPYHDKDLLQALLDSLLLERPYYHKDDKVYEQKRAWVFTQKAVEEGKLDYVIRPSKVVRPSVGTETLVNVAMPEEKPGEGRPAFLDVSQLELQTLPVKWRSKFWVGFSIGVLKDYNAAKLMEFFAWVGEQQGLAIDTDDLDIFLRKQVFRLLEDPSAYELLVEDAEMRKMWNTGLGRQYRNANELVVGLKGRRVDELRAIWKRPAGIVDLDLYNVSDFVGMSFLVLHKGRDVGTARGNIDELVLASKFISRVEKWEKEPLCVMYKMSDNTYSVLVGSSGVAYYERGLLAPEPVKALVYKHM
jgi:hypothetical protein